MDSKGKHVGGNKRDPYASSWTKEDEKYCARPAEVVKVRLRIHHGGIFVYHPSKMYVKGYTEEMNWSWDVDHMSYMDIAKMVKNLGYIDFKGLWYQHPKLSISRGLRPLNSDGDVVRFAEDVKGFEVIELFVDHLIDTPVVDEQEKDKTNKEDGEKGGEDDGLGEDGDGETESETEVDVEDDGYGDSESEVENEDNGEGEDESSEDEDYVAHGEEVDDSDMEDSDFDENWDWTSVLPTETVNEVRSNVAPPQTSRNPDPTSAVDFEDEEGDSSQLDTPPGSDDDEECSRKFPHFKVPEDDEAAGIRFEVGMLFNSKVLVREAVKEYAMQRKKNVYFKKNDKRRMVVKCLKDCAFYMRISKRSSSQYWQVVSLTDDHTCHRTARNRQAKTEYLAKKFMRILRHTPDIKTKALIAEAIHKWGVKLTHDQAYRAKKRAIEMIQGAGSEQYLHLRSYAEELRRSNPNNTVIIQCGNSKKGPIFERFYVCFEACKAAFVYTCRPLIGLDACFLKGEHGGQLLAAVGKDGNNMMIPIAWAVVEAETKDSWQWFLDLLLNDLCDLEQRDWAFISDQQKGLVPAIQNSMSNVEHRLCVKHLYGNWRKKYPGSEMKEVLWLAARATTIPDFQRAMQKMKAMNENAWKDMMQLPPAMWTKSHYGTDSQCDLQVNNMCEAFNKAILEHRDKPIITLLESLKLYITKRIVDQRDLMLRYRGNLCPKIQTILEKAKRASDGWTPYWHGDDDYALFAVSNAVDTYVVDLKQKTCACRKWDLTGIPCCHVVACLWHNKKDPEEYVSVYYRKNTFLSTYSHIILPSNGPKLWPILATEPINPPAMRRAPGRPKKKRNKSNDEPKNPHRLPRLLNTVKCKKCGQFGHNQRTCKGKTAADRQIPKGGNKRQKKARDSKFEEGQASRQTQTQASRQTQTQASSQPETSQAAQPASSQPQGATVLSQDSQAPKSQASQAMDN